MALPPLEPDHAVVAHRLESLDELGDAEVDKGFCYVRCASCDFDGWDRTFTAWPGSAYRSPSALVTFVEAQARIEPLRKCPECHEEARLEGLRVFVAANSIDRELVAEYSAKKGRTDFFLMDRAGNVDEAPPDGEALRCACFDSCVRAGLFIAEVTPARRQEAEALFQTVAEARPDRPQAHLALARLAFQSDDSDQALVHAERAAGCADDDVTTATKLGSLFGELAMASSDRGHLDESVRWYMRAMELSPNDRRLDLALARLLIQSGNFTEAVDYLDRAACAQSTTLEARYLQGVMALHEGRVRAAAQLLSELKEDVPGDPSVLHMLAWAAAQCGDRTTAEEALAQAERLATADDDHAYFVELVSEALHGVGEEPAD
ncbi:MAG: tetratricopeptide repeat protein [Planctomycetes bacterium]|nr:tetratricopeptide repeat protein [Planctomycetota bacterium]